MDNNKKLVDDIFEKLDRKEQLTEHEQFILDLVIPRENQGSNLFTDQTVERDSNKALVKGTSHYKGNDDRGVIDVLILACITGIISIASLLYIFIKI